MIYLVKIKEFICNYKKIIILFFFMLAIFYFNLVTVKVALANKVTNNTDDYLRPNLAGSFRASIANSSPTNKVKFNIPEIEREIVLSGDLHVRQRLNFNNNKNQFISIKLNNYNMYTDSDSKLFGTRRYSYALDTLFFGRSTKNARVNIASLNVRSIKKEYKSSSRYFSSGFFVFQEALAGYLNADIRNIYIEQENVASRSLVNVPTLLRVEGIALKHDEGRLKGNIKATIHDVYGKGLNRYGTTIQMGGGLFINGTSADSILDLNLKNITLNSTGRTALTYGGGLRTEGWINGRIVGSIRDNSIVSNGINAIIKDDIVKETAESFGGGIYTVFGGINNINANMIGNSAIASYDYSNLNGSALALGGAIYSSDSLAISGGTFTNNFAKASASNLAIAKGGAIYLDAAGRNDIDKHATSLILKLSNNDADIFFGNNSVIKNNNKEYNDIYIGQDHIEHPNSLKNAVMEISGSNNHNNNISILGGINVELNNGKSFVFNRRISSNQKENQFYWGGTNTFQTANDFITEKGRNNSINNGSAFTKVNFISGATHLQNDFKLNAAFENSSSEIFKIKFGKDHKLIINPLNREEGSAYFDLSRAKYSEVNIEKGSKIISPSNISVPFAGRSLLFKGVTTKIDLSNFTVVNSNNYKAELIDKDGQILIKQIYLPQNYSLKNNAKNLLKSGAFFDALPSNNNIANSLVMNMDLIAPESSLTSILINKRTHKSLTKKALKTPWSINNSNLNIVEFKNNYASNNNYINRKDIKLFENEFKLGFDKLSKNSYSLSQNNKPIILQIASQSINYLSFSNRNFKDNYSNSSLFNLWSSYFSLSGSFKNRNEYFGYKQNTNGLIAGVSYVNGAWKYIMYGGYSYTESNFNSSDKISTNNIHAGISGSYSYNSFDFILSSSYTGSRNYLYRNPAGTGIIRADFRQKFYSISPEVRYHLPVNFVDASVFVNLEKTFISQDEFSEKGGAMPSRIDSVNEQSLTTEIGIDLSKKIKVSPKVSFLPFINLSWIKEYGTKQISSYGKFISNGTNCPKYNLKSIEDDSFAKSVSGGFKFSYDSDDSLLRYDFGAAYEYYKNDYIKEHGIYGGFKVSF